MKILNLGILAHVDAGKTSLTERLLYAAGVIDQIGSVDAGNTQTDTLRLERQRGITIKSAVASFVIHDTTINLIDTPGHPDFIAEVERVLSVLDGVVLVISAVEGVQAQTRVLMRALQRLRIPTIIFVNKIDRSGARYESVLQEITDKLKVHIKPMGYVHELGTADARFAPYPTGTKPGTYPVFFGSAITGAGTNAITKGITTLLPVATGDIDDQPAGRIFKIERGRNGEKITLVRMFSGKLHTRHQVSYGNGKTAKVTAIQVFDRGTTVQRQYISAGEIGKLWGLHAAQIGDAIGKSNTDTQHHFAPPTLETVVQPCQAKDKGRLHVALEQLAEQDPLINLRQDDVRQELYVSLYGEVQKEVIQAMLQTDFGLLVDFAQTSTVCVERPTGVGQAVESGKRGDPFLATVGLCVEPAPLGSGPQFRFSQEVVGTMPQAFFKAVEDTVLETLHQGLHGWQVTDCLVTMTHSGYFPRQSHAHARFDKSMSSTGADFRGLTPLVLMTGLEQAGTMVCEPVHQFELEVPADSLRQLLPVLVRFQATPETTEQRGAVCALRGSIPAVHVHEFQQQLPGLTSGEGTLEYAFDRYEPVRGAPPVRPRTDYNPLDRKEYLLRVLRQA